MSIRKIAVFVLFLAMTGGAARADVGLGIFLGQPTGFDAKIGIDNRSGIDLLLGWDTYQDSGHSDYAHVTYLLTPFVGRGRSVLVPFRIGLGLAVYDAYYYRNQFGDGLNAAVRLPIELGLRFRSVPLEIYGELALRVNFVRADDRYHRSYLDGGIGIRFYL